MPLIPTPVRKWIRRQIGPSKAELRAQAAMNQYRKLRARYDAAQTTAENAAHWAYADDLSARAANTLSVRRTVRRRARYEAANNSYCAGMLLTRSNDIVGTGPRLQMQGEAGPRIEQAFGQWAREVKLAAKLRTAVLTKIRDGEVFIRLTTNPAHRSPVWLDIEVIEGDQVTTPHLVPDERNVDGITFDEFQNPTTYHILRQHPGDEFAMTTIVPDPVAASQVLHWFRSDRPGQRRGIPEITPALPLYAQLRRFTLSVITAAETASDHAAVLFAGGPGTDANEVDELDPFDQVAFQRGMMTAVPYGWQLGQLKAEQPTTTYGMFKQEILNEIARCQNMPYNVAAGNSSGYNYSSGRLDHQIYFRAIGIDQQDLESVILDRIFEAWLAEARLIVDDLGTPYVADVDLRSRPYSWSWDPAEDLDPTKTAQARLIDLQAGMLSIPAAYAAMGLDWQVEQTRQAEALGITVQQLRELQIQQLYGTALSTQAGEQALQARRSRRKRRSKLSRWLGA